jgi:hypothetical protein
VPWPCPVVLSYFALWLDKELGAEKMLSQNGAVGQPLNFPQRAVLSPPQLKPADDEESNRPISTKSLMQIIIGETERWEG